VADRKQACAAVAFADDNESVVKTNVRLTAVGVASNGWSVARF